MNLQSVIYTTLITIHQIFLELSDIDLCKHTHHAQKPTVLDMTQNYRHVYHNLAPAFYSSLRHRAFSAAPAQSQQRQAA